MVLTLLQDIVKLMFEMTNGLDSARDAILQTPKYEPNANFPLLVFLDGAAQSADEMFDYLGTAPKKRV